MRLFYFLAIALSLVTAAHGQQLVTRVDTVYFDHDWERTPYPADRVYARIARRDAQGKPVGTVRDYFYPSWKKQFEGKIAQENPDKAAGLCTGWYESGQLQFKGTFVNGESQADYREWREDGTEIVTTYEWSEVVAVDQVKLHSYYNAGDSRHVVPVDLPEGTVGIIYRFDIRDEDQPPVTWSTALTLAATLATAPTGAGVTLLLSSGAKALASEQSATAAVTTKCRFFVVDQAALVKPFTNSATKGTMPAPARCYQQAINRAQETRQLVIPADVNKLYFAFQNDNLRTSARLRLTVSALVGKRD